MMLRRLKRIRYRLSVGLMAFLTVLMGCTPQGPISVDWCYIFDFTTQTYNADISLGSWQAGGGLTTAEADPPSAYVYLSASYGNSAEVYPTNVVATVGRIPGVTGTGDITVAVVGSMFGIPLVKNLAGDPYEDTILANFTTFDIQIVPPLAGGAIHSNNFNVAIRATDHFQVRTLKVYGNGANPFPQNDCIDDPEEELTGTPLPPTAPFTPTYTVSPTLTPTPTITLTPSITPTCTATSPYNVWWGPPAYPWPDPSTYGGTFAVTQGSFRASGSNDYPAGIYHSSASSSEVDITWTLPALTHISSINFYAWGRRTMGGGQNFYTNSEWLLYLDGALVAQGDPARAGLDTFNQTHNLSPAGMYSQIRIRVVQTDTDGEAEATLGPIRINSTCTRSETYTPTPTITLTPTNTPTRDPNINTLPPLTLRTSVPQWCYAFNLGSSDGGFESGLPEGWSGGATWVSGEGWQSGIGSRGIEDESANSGLIMRMMPAMHVTYIQMRTAFNLGTSYPSSLYSHSFTIEYGNTILARAVLNPPGGAIRWQGDRTVAARLWYFGGILAQRTDGLVPNGFSIISEITLRGVGNNPFGADNCAPPPTSTPRATRVPIGGIFPTVALPQATYTALPTYTIYPTQTLQPGTGTPIVGMEGVAVPWLPGSGSGDGSGGQGDELSEYAEGLENLGGDLIGATGNIIGQAEGYFNTLTGSVGSILNGWNNASPLPLPGTPRCSTDRLASELCAIWYILTWTLFSGPVGSLIIPIATFGIILLTAFTFIKQVKGLLEELARLQNI